MRNTPESGHMPDAVLAYVHAAVSNVVAAAKGLARQPNKAYGRTGQQPDPKGKQ